MELAASGLLLVEPKGKRNLYRANLAHPLYPELRSLFFKTVQLNLSPAGLIKEPLSEPGGAEDYCWGSSPKIQEVYGLIEKVARTDSTVLLTGETGSGKGVLARLIHEKSLRRDGPFIPVNSGGIPETFLESELFGHRKGAFTGAIRDKAGLFEAAEQGTIFLDEIANASLLTQSKILEAVEDRIIRRVGETQTRKVDARLICATNRDLWKEVRSGRFREDLYHRLNVLVIRVPPLRERVDDIPILARFFIQKFFRKLGRPPMELNPDLLPLLTSYTWPGNIRELSNAIERAVLLSEGPKITRADLPEELAKPEPERERILRAIRAAHGNLSSAARRLKISRAKLYRLIAKYEIKDYGFSELASRGCKRPQISIIPVSGQMRQCRTSLTPSIHKAFLRLPEHFVRVFTLFVYKNYTLLERPSGGSETLVS